MPRFLRPLIVALLILPLAGCLHPVKLPLIGTLDTTPPPSRDAAMQRLAEATPCCQGWADLPYHTRLPREPREFTIDQFSPVAEIDAARTPFLTFSLPTYEQPYRIAFQSQASARHLGNSFLLAPTVTLLDAERRPISSTDLSLCIYFNWRPNMSGAFGAITIDKPDARYLVITTSPRQLAATTYWAQSPASFNKVEIPKSSTYSGFKSAAPVTSGSYDIPHAPQGTLFVGRMTPAYADAVAQGMCGKPAQGSGLLPELRRAMHNR